MTEPLSVRKSLEISSFMHQLPLGSVTLGHQGEREREQDELSEQEGTVVQNPVDATHIRVLPRSSHVILDDSFTLSLTVKNKNNDTFPVFMLKN